MSDSVVRSERRRWWRPDGRRLVLLAALLVGLLLRLWIAGARPDNTRHFDERFSFRNVEALLSEGTLEPANAYYPNLSWLPQALVMGAGEQLSRATGVEALSIYSERTTDGWSPTAYRLARGVSVLWGVLGILAVHALGRRLFGADVGLVAAVLVATLPPHIVSSGLFKPDILVSLMVSLTLLWSLEAGRRAASGDLSLRGGAGGWFLLAGCGVGLAVAAKYTGVGAAFPVGVAALWGGWRSPRRWLLLAAAGLASLAVFFALNPRAAVVFEYLPRLWGIMESKGEAAGGSHLAVVGQELAYVVRHHGPWVTGLAMAGLGGLLVQLFRRLPADVTELVDQRREAAQLLSYVLGYPALYAASTALFKGQNLLPLLPLVAILASWTAVLLWYRFSARWPILRRAWVALPLALLLLAALLVAPWRTVYRTARPSTYQLAGRYLASRLEPPEARRFYFEKRGEAVAAMRDGHRLPGLPVGRLAEVPAADLDHADAVAFFADRLESADAELYLRRLAARGGAARRFEPALPDAWGPGLVVVLNGWETAAPAERLRLSAAVGGPGAIGESGGTPATALLARPLSAAEPVSFTLRVPRSRRGPRPGALWIAPVGDRGPGSPGGAVEAPLILTRLADRTGHYQTAKLELPPGTTALTLALGDGVDLPGGVEIDLWRWRRPG